MKSHCLLIYNYSSIFIAISEWFRRPIISYQKIRHNNLLVTYCLLSQYFWPGSVLLKTQLLCLCLFVCPSCIKEVSITCGIGDPLISGHLKFAKIFPHTNDLWNRGNSDNRGIGASPENLILSACMELILKSPTQSGHQY